MTATPSPVDVDRLELELTDHPDRDFVSYLVTGFRKGFLIGLKEIPKDTYECRNNLSAIKNPSIVDELLRKEIEKGFIMGPFDSPPFDKYRVNALSLVEKNMLILQNLG